MRALRPSWGTCGTRWPAWAVLAALGLALSSPATAQDTALSDRAKGLDGNGNGVIDRNEAGGPLAANFEEIDCDKSGSLDGAEISGFFQGTGCPKTAATRTAAQAGGPPGLSPRAKAADANGNDVIERSEAGGPLAANFDKIDKDKSGALDGAEIRAFFQGGGSASGGPRPGGRPPATVRLDKVIAEPLGQTIPVIGRLVARQTGVIASEIRGAVMAMRVDVGDRVARGAVIAVISADRLRAVRDRYAASVGRFKGMVATAEAEYRKKQRELQRLDRLRKSAAFSRARYEDIERDVQSRRGTLAERKAQLKEARAQLRQAQIDLDDTEIKAPFPGVVTQKHIDVGTYVAVGARVVSLLNDTDIEAEAEVPADRMRGLRVGAAVRLRLDDGTLHRAVVRAIVPSENVRTRTRPVRFTPRFNGTRGPLAANQSVTVLIPIGGGQTVATVHKDAVVRRGADAFVYVVEGTNARRVKVLLGDAIGPRFVVLEGVKPGQKVVVRGNETLGLGGQVRVTGPLGGA